MKQTHGNMQKYLNPNPLQQVLLGRFRTQILRLLYELDPCSVLDAGCGTGQVGRSCSGD